MRPLFFLVACLALLAAPLSAHDLGLAQVELTRTETGDMSLSAKLSATVQATDPVVAPACTSSHAIARDAPGGNQRVRWIIACPGLGESTDVLLPWALQAAMVTRLEPGGQATSKLIQAGPDGIRLSLTGAGGHPPSFWTALVGYTSLGIQHILIGLDHIALLVCLALLASGWTLVRLATAFTTGHSLTLCLAAFDILRVPAGPMEAVIALSVVFLARDVVLGRRLGRRHTALLAGVGLVHGLGFASVLGEIGLPNTARISALLGFNLGVEIGQILVLFALIQGSAVLARLVQLPERAGGLVAGAAIGSIAAFWTLERVMSLA
ncbi:HupE/UreJ family protein [Ruegeria sediminis]|uniref:HupE/UreJ family protein n=1 Tax=Ruegeria sediminis TaxID=2583820 RepID=A0ABY2X286_9RHOB|nr:HupE/UreJ family protein [Ruegeria sediminis]TMV09077.1 HupE/UreJ family protein [Ruegeria sediminis]